MVLADVVDAAVVNSDAGEDGYGMVVAADEDRWVFEAVHGLVPNSRRVREVCDEESSCSPGK